MANTPNPTEGWHVHLSVSADEGADLLKAAPGIVEHGASLVVSPGSELKELVLFSREDDEDRAREAASDIYQRLRRVAGLDPQPARVVSLERPSGNARGGARKHRLDVTLIKEATRVLRSESHHEWVVVLAQTACEVYVRDVLERSAAQLGDVAIESVRRLPSTNLDNEEVRRVFHELTGYTPPQDTEWWREYQAHVQRRHRIVHAGARVTRQDAEASIEAAKALIDFLHWPSMRIDAGRE
jgi:HEPN domain-containing protein